MNIPTSAQQICLCPPGEETWGWVRWSIAGVNSGAEDVLFRKCLDPLIFLPLMSEISFFRQWHWDQSNTRKPFSSKEYVCYKHLQRPWNQVTWITHTFLCFCFACGWQFQPLRKKKKPIGQKDDSPGHSAVTSIYCLHIYQIKSQWSERGNLCSAYEYKNNGLQASRNFCTHGLWIQTGERIVCDQSHYAIERQNLGFKIWLLSANMWTFCTLFSVLGLLTSFSSIESRSAFKMLGFGFFCSVFALKSNLLQFLGGGASTTFSRIIYYSSFITCYLFIIVYYWFKYSLLFFWITEIL